MTTIRQAHHKKFVCITNKLAQNNALSLKARGLMLYLLSLPDDWRVHINHLEKVMLEGRDALLSAFRELKKAGYVKHQKMGFKSGWTYWVFEEPTSDEEFKKFLRTNGFPNKWVSQQMGNPQLQNTNTSTKPSPSIDVEDEPNRTEYEGGTERNGSSSSSKRKNSPSLEEIEMVKNHASGSSEGKILLKHFDIRQWVKKYGLEKTIQVVDLAVQDIKSGSLLTNPAGWITNALKEGY